jgi:hypothetical protein
MFSRRNFALLILIVSAVTILRLPAVGVRAASGHTPQSPSGDSSAKVCEFASPGVSFSIPYVAQAGDLNTNPGSPTWAHAASTWIVKDWSYPELNLWLPADNTKDRLKLWDRDVVEFFLGDDWQDIMQYREFEVAPTGDWVDLAIDLKKDTYDAKWDSGWQRQGRIDEKNHVWYAAARVPLRSVSEKQVQAGTKWRVNLYRIDGLGEDPVRHFMCWQPTCVVNRDPNHVPEHFGTLVFTK